MATPAYQPERRRLAETLRSLRVGAGLSGERLSQLLGWGAGQSKVSKIETIKQLPTDEDLAAWAAATRASRETLDELQGMLRRARVEYAGWKDAYRSVGASGVQADILALEAGMTRIAEFQPAMISGLVQTADYARDFLHLPCGPLSYGESEDEIEQTVATRMRRQQVLYEPGKQVQVVMLEAALRTQTVSAPTLLGQLDRLVAVSGLSTVELGIIPFGVQVPVWPLSGFRLYDDLVIVESIVGEQNLSEPETVTRYEKYLEWLRDAASTGDNARRLITAAAAALR